MSDPISRPESSPGYRQTFQRSVDDREGFWLEAAKLVDWVVEPTTALDSTDAPLYRWFAGAELNTCFNALDRHVLAGRGEETALIYDSPVVGKKKSYSYATLLDKVVRFAGVLADAGVGKGDRVIIYMPMMPQAIVAMLACARLGAVHSVVFGGFGEGTRRPYRRCRPGRDCDRHRRNRAEPGGGVPSHHLGRTRIQLAQRRHSDREGPAGGAGTGERLLDRDNRVVGLG